jgi:hypothetical protein
LDIGSAASSASPFSYHKEVMRVKMAEEVGLEKVNDGRRLGGKDRVLEANLAKGCP